MTEMKSFGMMGFALLLIGSITMNAHAGTISGTVKFAGTEIPAPEMLKINKDEEVCGKDVPSNALLISKKNKGVQNAVVRIQMDGAPDKKLTVPMENLKFVQEKCGFTPRVLLLPPGVEFEIHNKDPLTHNIHTFGRENATINKGQPKTVPIIKHTFEVPERIKVKCDIHKWMQGWFIVSDNAYVSLSDTNGSFSIQDIPPGTYTLQVWHEALGPQKKEIIIKGDEEVKVDFDLEKKKKRKRKKKR